VFHLGRGAAPSGIDVMAATLPPRGSPDMSNSDQPRVSALAMK
jgi:hypothetical protein